MGSYRFSNARSSLATEQYVGTQITNLIAGAPASLNTLDELAAAINDDPSFSTTVNNSLATKASTGKAIAMAIVFGG